MTFVLLALLIALVIAFFVVVWKAAKDWRWYQIVAVCVTMLLAVAFIFPVAVVLKSRSAWHKVHEELSARLEAAEAEQHVLKHGDPTDPTAGEGVVLLAQQLSKLGIEAGRSWRNLRLQNVNNGAVTLIQPTAADAEVLPDAAAPEAVDAAAPATALIPEGSLVYGFAEQPQPNAPVPVPTFYLGEFRVTASAPDQVTLTPTSQLEGPQVQAIEGRQATSWSLYELLPLDGHEPFIAEGSVPDNENIFGRVNDELVRQLLGQRVDEQTLTSYLRDGSRATPDDPPMSRWVKVEFTKPFTIDVDSPEQRGALDGGFFDGNGRAVDSRLQRGETGTLSFAAGTQIVVKEEAANVLFDENVARLVDTYFVRPLNDYSFVLRRIRLRLTELTIRQEELEYEKQVLEDAIAATVAMLTQNQTSKLQLEQDLAQTRVEQRAIADYKQKLQDQVAQTRETLVRLYRSNQSLEEQLQQIHQTIQRNVDAVTLAGE